MGFSIHLQRLVSGSMLCFLMGCTNDGNSLAGDYASMSKCPPGGCASLEPTQNQLTMTRQVKDTIYQPMPTNYTDFIEVSGECYASTYPQNRIDVKIRIQSSSEFMNIGADNIKAILGSSTTPACYQGRFNIAINGAAMPSGNLYVVQAELVGIVPGVREDRNAGSGLLTVKVSR